MADINKNNESLLSLDLANKLLSYNPESGEFIWLVNAGKSGHIKAGSVAGGIDSANGYRRIQINGKPYRAHRLAWFFATGKFPSEFLDHINGIKSDNRIANLREATSDQNNRNVGLRKVNTSGVVGVYKCANSRHWYAQIKVNGKNKHLGYFEIKEDAIKARKTAEDVYHGEFSQSLRITGLAEGYELK